MIKAVIFDFDDTLSMTEEACFLLENDVLESLSRPKMSREIHLETWGKPLFEAIELRSPGINVVEFRKRFEKFQWKYINSGRFDKIPNENLEVLEKLADQGKYLAIVTSRTESELQHIFEESHPLNELIEDIFHKENILYQKPDPRVFDIIFQKGFKPDECLYVGDSLTDAEAAIGAGMKFVASLESELRTKEEFSNYAVDYFIRDLPELPGVIEKLDNI